jgi:hypothetical protein
MKLFSRRSLQAPSVPLICYISNNVKKEKSACNSLLPILALGWWLYANSVF